MTKIFPVFVLGFILAACAAPRSVSKPGVDFSRIQSIAVVDQERDERRGVTDEVARHLIRRGYKVTVARGAGSTGADALLQVNVSQFLPDKKYLVQLDQDGGGRGRDVLLVNPAVELSGRTVYPSMGIPGVDDAQIIVSNATVSLSARLMDRSTREVLWSGSITYEGLDLNAAVEGAVSSLMKEFPGLRKG